MKVAAAKALERKAEQHAAATKATFLSDSSEPFDLLASEQGSALKLLATKVDYLGSRIRQRSHCHGTYETVTSDRVIVIRTESVDIDWMRGEIPCFERVHFLSNMSYCACSHGQCSCAIFFMILLRDVGGLHVFPLCRRDHAY